MLLVVMPNRSDRIRTNPKVFANQSKPKTAFDLHLFG
jgi:hypothetical protein